MNMAEKYENFQLLRVWLRQSPFHAFEVVLVDGRKYAIQHPENLMLPRNPRESLIAVQNARGDIELFNALVISAVRPLSRRGKRRKAG